MENFLLFRNMSVMVVEDDIQAAKHLQEIMDNIFAEVHLVHDGEAALELYYEKKPDLLLVDIMMPKKGGFELIKEIRMHDPLIKIVIITAHSSHEYFREALKLKTEDYLIKPVGFEDFIEVFSSISKQFQTRYPHLLSLLSGAEIHWFEKSVLYENQRYNLTKSEFKLLELFVSKKNQIVSKDAIENVLYYGGSMSESALKSLINKLRQKIGKSSIETYSGYGYKLITQ